MLFQTHPCLQSQLMGSNVALLPINFHHTCSTKYLLLCSTEASHSYNFGTAGVNDEWIFILFEVIFRALFLVSLG